MIYEITMFGARCDNCDKKWENEDTGSIAYTDDSSMLQVLEDEEWHIERGHHGKDDKHYCYDCFLGFDDDDKIILKNTIKTC